MSEFKGKSLEDLEILAVSAVAGGSADTNQVVQ